VLKGRRPLRAAGGAPGSTTLAPVNPRRDDDDFEVVDAVPVDPDAPAPYPGPTPSGRPRPRRAVPGAEVREPRARARPSGRSLAAAVAAVPVAPRPPPWRPTGLGGGRRDRRRRRAAPPTARGEGRPPGPRPPRAPVVASRSFVVDIHLLAPRD
jgi:hypothetical protein